MKANFMLVLFLAMSCVGADAIESESPCLAVGRARIDMTFNRIGADVDSDAYPQIMAKLEICLQTNEICIAEGGFFGKAADLHREYKFRSAKSYKDKLVDSPRSAYGPVVAFVQFKDPSAPEGVCLYALNTGPTASPWRTHAWQIQSGQPIWVAGLQDVSTIYGPTNNDSAPTLIKKLLGDYRYTLQKAAKAAQQPAPQK